MLANTYLAELEEPSLWGTTSECLVVFLPQPERAPTCLTDPEMIGFHPAYGHWCLLGVDRDSGRAFYTRFDHSAPLSCDPLAS